ncbi:MAG TPA: phosphoribosyltransferase family protein [Polyangia bacterium]|nr:phosphoribosyltransferase family protein [Polyangia bacterium]
MPLSPSVLLAAALETLWPAACAACDRPIPDAALFCALCYQSVSPLFGACAGCALPMLDPDDAAQPGTRCRTCRRVPLPFAAATAGFEYGEALARGLVRMKHGGRRHLARRLARLLVRPLAEALARGGFTRADAIVAVPLHEARLRTRGFNQALELARWALDGLARTPALAPRGGLPALERHLLRRVRPTRALGHAGPAARFTEVAGAFLCEDPARLRGRRVLLVDDVYTTGATFGACADALLRAGAREVHALALARAV